MPTNMNLSFNFNTGSFLGFILIFQIISGLCLTILFNPSIYNFFLLLNLSNESFFFFFLRFFHANGASFFFFLIIYHIFRGLFFFSFLKSKLFISGIVIYFLLMMISFFGYVLPWGQMSYWGSSVITNFLSVLKTELVFFLWGDFMPDNQLMFFFFALHFLLPFILLIISLAHILLLHSYSSSSKIYKSNMKKKNLFFFLFKDMNNFFIIFMFYSFIFFFFNYLGDPENFIESNKMVTPNHIKPEWYFLWAYSILRAVPSKLGGVLLLVLSVLFLLKYLINNKNFNNQLKILNLIFIVFILTFLGGKPVEMPYLIMSQMFTFLYFLIISI